MVAFFTPMSSPHLQSSRPSVTTALGCKEAWSLWQKKSFRWNPVAPTALIIHCVIDWVPDFPASSFYRLFTYWFLPGWNYKSSFMHTAKPNKTFNKKPEPSTAVNRWQPPHSQGSKVKAPKQQPAPQDLKRLFVPWKKMSTITSQTNEAIKKSTDRSLTYQSVTFLSVLTGIQIAWICHWWSQWERDWERQLSALGTPLPPALLCSSQSLCQGWEWWQLKQLVFIFT